MRFYLTTAIDYVNSRPHLGTAYEKIAADVIARHRRLAGIDTHFVMGNDEHSQNVYRRAREAGEDPQIYCDRMADTFRDVWARLNVSFDDFIRTTEPRHRRAVQTLLQRCHDAGDVYEGEYTGFYCVSCEAFKQQKDLVDGLCPIHLTRPEWIRERNHFFRLSKYRDRLLAHFDAHPEFLVPDVRRHEMLRLLEGGLDDISISRAGQAWGIPVPFAPASVVYVWFDALINYVSAVGYGTDAEQFAHWWPADLHVIGKDITRFHCVVWPAMLMSAGLALPAQVFGHGWVNFRGQRMSKTLGTVVDPLAAADRLGPDPLRLYLVKEIPFGGDGDFSWERFEERYNSDLANNLGNLVNRVTSMVERYQQGVLRPPSRGPGRLADAAAEVVGSYAASMRHFALHEATASAFRLLDATNGFIAESEPWALAKSASDADRLGQVLMDSAEALRIAAVLLLPVMPVSCAEILRRCGETTPVQDLRFARDAAWKTGAERQVIRAPALWPRLEAREPRDPESGNALAPGAAPAREEITVSDANDSPERPRAMEHATTAVPADQAGVPTQASVTGMTPAAPSGAGGSSAPASPTASASSGAAAPGGATSSVADTRLSIDEFMKIDLRVARVISAERVPKSKKLVKLHVDLGTEQRTLVAGIAEAYEPDALTGRTVVIVANLRPAVLMGIESNGMVLAASPEGGRPELVSFVNPPPPGSRVR